MENQALQGSCENGGNRKEERTHPTKERSMRMNHKPKLTKGSEEEERKLSDFSAEKATPHEWTVIAKPTITMTRKKGAGIN